MKESHSSAPSCLDVAPAGDLHTRSRKRSADIVLNRSDNDSRFRGRKHDGWQEAQAEVKAQHEKANEPRTSGHESEDLSMVHELKSRDTRGTSLSVFNEPS